MRSLIRITLTCFTAIILLGSCAQTEDGIVYREKQETENGYQLTYNIGNWDHPSYKDPFESYGNHRIVIRTDVEDPVVQVKIPWRRRDKNPEQKEIIIVDGLTGESVLDKYIIDVSNESGHLLFKRNEGSNIYYIYYLPHRSTGSYYPVVEYIKSDNDLKKEFLIENSIDLENLDSIAEASLISAEAIDDFHSFFPMEIISGAEDLEKYYEVNDRPYYLFPEYRTYPVRMTDYIPFRWTKENAYPNGLSDNVRPGEYYTFQVAIFSPLNSIDDISFEYSDMKGKKGVISNERITCFNKGGIDLNGKSFSKTLSIQAGYVQSLWFGIDMPDDFKGGSYSGYVLVRPEGLPADTVYLNLNVSGSPVNDRGDSSPELMSRMRWLNSTIGTDPEFIIEGFEPVSISDKTISILGRELKLGRDGLPSEISSYFAQEMTKLNDTGEEILSSPVLFEVSNKGGRKEMFESEEFDVNQSYLSAAFWSCESNSENFSLSVKGSLEYDGMLDYKIALIAKEDLNLDDITTTIPMQSASAEYLLGLGYKGTRRPDKIDWKWDVKKHQEGAWLGTINKGLQYVLRDENYERPLNTNFYQDKPLNLPPSWYNDGRGGIQVDSKGTEVIIKNYSGAREVSKGDTLHFNIRFLISPFKLIDTKEHFNTRFVHKYLPVDSVKNLHGTIVNVHHANEINPYINYPFFNTEMQKDYIDEAHSKGIKVKLYNTIRELSYKSYELFALKSLNYEILNNGKGGGHTWLQEHLGSDYYSAWHATSVNDAAVLNKGNSRWTNYYIEGINWLAKNQEIDGLYLDDIAFSRATVKRIASVFSKQRGGYVIDLHSANQYNNRDGFINSAFLYMEHFPYMSRLWFGEYFDYYADPDYWFTEVSGLPFGLTGEMLQDGGRPYHGLIFGMTTRVYGSYNPAAIWKQFDDYNIAESEMLGYWVDRSPIKTKTEDIKSTVYLHDDKAFIVLASWSDTDLNVDLLVDWENLGFDRTSLKLYSPQMDDMQDYSEYDIGSPILVPAQSGLILILE